jgi:SAM-dependent methyltransferase
MTQQEEIVHPTVTQQLLVLRHLITQQWKPQAIRVAAQLEVAEVLADGPHTVAQLAETTGTHAPSLYRLLRALARIGIFIELDGSRFANSELSHFLRPHVSRSVYGMAMNGADWTWRSWGELLYSVQTGEPSFNKIHGMSVWQYFTERDPAAGAMFNKSMSDNSPTMNLPIAQAADLSGVRTVVDVGGGRGDLLATLLATHPTIENGILFDQPHVIDEARAALGPALDGKVQLESGDFFTAVPAGADAYVMRLILHDWDDTACVKLLANCRRAMAPHGRVLAAELIVDADHSDEFTYFLDLQMLVNFTGKERTAAEFHELYAAAGLRLTRIIPTTSMVSLIEGIRVDNG